MPVLYAGWGKGRLPNMTEGHVFVREPVNQVPCPMFTIRYVIYIIYSKLLTAWGGGGGGGGDGGMGVKLMINIRIRTMVMMMFQSMHKMMTVPALLALLATLSMVSACNSRQVGTTLS